MLRFGEALVASMVLYFSKNEFSFSLIRLGEGKARRKVRKGAQAIRMVAREQRRGREQR